MTDDALDDRWRDDVLEAQAAGLDEAATDRLLRHLRDRLGTGLNVLRRTVRGLGQGAAGADIGDTTTAARAHQWIRAQEELGGFRPGPGCFYYTRANDAVWRTLTIKQAATQIGNAVTGPQAKTRSDYRNIAKQALDIMESEPARPRADTPAAGFALNGSCLILDSGRVVEEDLRADHYCRFRVEADRMPIEESKFYRRYLDALGPEGSEIRDVFGQAAFMVLFNLGETLQKAILFYGAAGSGKSTGQAILSALVPEELRCSVEPHRWGHEYQLAMLSRAVLNVVEDADYKSMLGNDFKRLVGNQTLVSAREPYGDAFAFRPATTHLFSANELPATRVLDEGFWRRWKIVHFRQALAAREQVRDLGQQIIDHELGAVIQHALEAGRALFDERGALQANQSAAELAIIRGWEEEQNLVLQFLKDEDWVDRGEEFECGRAALWGAYKSWAKEHGYALMGHRTYLRELRRLAPDLGVRLVKKEHERVWRGIGLTNVGKVTF